MNYRRKVSTLSVLVALFSATLIVGIFLLPYGPFARRSRAAIANFDPLAVHMIELNVAINGLVNGAAAGREAIVLRAADGANPDSGTAMREWHYLLGDDSVPTENDNVETFLAAFSQLQRYRTVTANPELYLELGVAADAATRVRLYDSQGGTIADLLLGNADPQRGVYARLNGSDTVELVSSDLTFYLEQQPGYWQRKTLFPPGINAADVVAVSVFADNIAFDDEEGPLSVQYQLIRSASSADGGQQMWQVSGNPAVVLDQLRVENIASGILITQADSFYADQARQIDFDADAQARIVVELGNGNSYSFAVIKDDASPTAYVLRVRGPGVLNRADGSDYLYNVNTYSVRPFVRPLSDLLPPVEEVSAP